jgi:Type II secretion system protein B
VPAMPIAVEQAPAAPPASSAASLEEDGGTAAPADPVVTGNGSEPQTAAPPASVSREGLLELWQLTEAEQKYLQGLDVSFHVHSNDPAKRAVIINGLRAREGQSLGEDLRLAEIVPDGIVLEFQGQFVHLANPQPY